MAKLIGSAPSQVPTNGDLGDLAFQNKDSVKVKNLTVEEEFTSTGIDDNATSTAVTIDSSENVLVGTTDNSPANNSTDSSADNGISLKGSIGKIEVARYNSYPIEANRTGSDGDIMYFRKSGSPVGSIGTKNAPYFINNTNGGIKLSGISVFPCDTTGAIADNTFDLGDGNSNTRWKDLYLGGNIYLGGTTSANALDDYETGTFTPQFLNGTGITYTSQIGTYIKVGNLVTAIFDITVSALGSNGNEVIITLPFTGDSNLPVVYSWDGYASNLVHGGTNGSPTSGHNANIARNPTSTNRIVLSENSGKRLSYSDLQSSGRIAGAVTYTLA